MLDRIRDEQDGGIDRGEVPEIPNGQCVPVLLGDLDLLAIGAVMQPGADANILSHVYQFHTCIRRPLLLDISIPLFAVRTGIARVGVHGPAKNAQLPR